MINSCYKIIVTINIKTIDIYIFSVDKFGEMNKHINLCCNDRLNVIIG